MIALVDTSRPPTFESENYSRDDWLPVFQLFEAHEDVQRNPETANVEQLLTDPENTTGSNLVYDIIDTDGELQLAYSPYRRSTNGHMLWGTLSYDGDFAGGGLRDARDRIASTHATAYLTPMRGQFDLAEIIVPESYDPTQVEASIHAGVTIAREVETLECHVWNAIDEYQASR